MGSVPHDSTEYVHALYFRSPKYSLATKKEFGVTDARLVLDKFSKQDVFKWNRTIALYTKQGRAEVALKVFHKMEQEGVKPNGVTFTNILKACASLGALEQGQQIHAHVVNYETKQNLVMVNSLLNMYAKCGKLAEALQIFAKMPKRNIISWNSMITGYIQHGHPREALNLFCQMDLEGVKPDEITFVGIVKACSSLGALEQGKKIHAQIIQRGFKPNIFMGNTLVDMYAKCGDIEHACQLFDELPRRDVVSWTAMIAGYVYHGYPEQALKFYQKMQWEGVKPNKITFMSILNGCASLGDLKVGKQIHDDLKKTPFEFDSVVGSTLISMYAKCGSLLDAQNVFEKMPRGNAAPWTAMLAAYGYHGNGEEAFELYCCMRHECVKPDAFTFLIILKACISLKAFDEAKQIHIQIMSSGFESDIYVGSTLVDIYAKCGNIEDARLVFNRMLRRDVVSWTAMITGYGQHGKGEQALNLFQQMQFESIKPNEFTFLSVLNACANLAILEEGRQIHSQIVKSGLEITVLIGNALVDMYSKCGSLIEACFILENLPEPNLVSWTAMIAGYALHGCGKEALQLFDRMQIEGVQLDRVTFIGVLSACSHSGLVYEGCYFFESMSQDHGIIPTEEHYACMVDLFGRIGCLQEADNFVRNMPIDPTAVVWRSLLSACSIHGYLELAVHAAACILKLEPQNTSACVLLSNMYAANGTWDCEPKI